MHVRTAKQSIVTGTRLVVAQGQWRRNLGGRDKLIQHFNCGNVSKLIKLITLNMYSLKKKKSHLYRFETKMKSNEIALMVSI